MTEAGPTAAKRREEEEQPPDEESHKIRSILLAVAPVWGLASFFLGWEIYVRVTGIRRLTLPLPSDILRHVAENTGFYWEHGLVTVQEAFWGFLLAFIAAVLVATAMAHSRFVERATMPVIVLIQSTPIEVLVPVFLLWFGFSPWPKKKVSPRPATL